VSAPFLKGPNFLLDTSSLLLLTRSELGPQSMKFRIIQNSRVLDLTTYEAGNGIWKESELLKTLSSEETQKLADSLSLILSDLERSSVQPSEFTQVLNLAKSERRTFYDSSYIYVAKRDKMTLVTEDQNLSKIARKHVRVLSVEQLVANLGN
jgi:predicted nucleic acid-binding protein